MGRTVSLSIEGLAPGQERAPIAADLNGTMHENSKTGQKHSPSPQMSQKRTDRQRMPPSPLLLVCEEVTGGGGVPLPNPPSPLFFVFFFFCFDIFFFSKKFVYFSIFCVFSISLNFLFF